MELKRIYSYFIIKPDGVKHFPKIKNIIEQELEQGVSIRYFKIDNFGETIKKLYYKHFQKENFGKSFEQYLAASNSLFGNFGILIIVSIPKSASSKEFLDKVLKIKYKIRDQLIDPNVCAISNDINSSNKNKVIIIDENGREEKQNFFKDKGYYRISGFNIIHCPDATEEDTNRELEILCESGIISNRNMFDQIGIKELLRFRSGYGFDGECSSEPRPNIAGFIEYEIKKPNSYIADR